RIVEHDANALELLQTKYPQYRDDPPAGPFIVLAVESRREWSGAGRLDSAPQPGKPKGERMAILIMGEIPANSDQYDQISRQMGISDDNLPEGLISHVAGPTDGGMEVVDVWES